MSYKKYLEEGGLMDSPQQDLMAGATSSPNMFGASNPSPSTNPTGGGIYNPSEEKAINIAETMGASIASNMLKRVLDNSKTNTFNMALARFDDKFNEGKLDPDSLNTDLEKIAFGYAISSFKNYGYRLGRKSFAIDFVNFSMAHQAATDALSQIMQIDHPFKGDTQAISKMFSEFKISNNIQKISEYFSAIKPALAFSFFSQKKWSKNIIKQTSPNQNTGGFPTIRSVIDAYIRDAEQQAKSQKSSNASVAAAGTSGSGVLVGNMYGVMDSGNPNIALDIAKKIAKYFFYMKEIKQINIPNSSEIKYPFSIISLKDAGGGVTQGILAVGLTVDLSDQGMTASDLDVFRSGYTKLKEGGKMNKLKLIKMQDGGIMEGPSHEEGGVPIVSEEGEVMAEMEGKELILSTEDTDAMDTMARDFIETGEEDILREIGAYFVNARIKQEAINPSEEGIGGLDPDMMGMEEGEEDMMMEDDMAMDEGMMAGDMEEEEMPIARYGMKMKKMSKGGKGLYDNINAKRERIAKGSGEKMRKKGDKGAPSDKDFKDAAKTAKMKSGGKMNKTEYYRMLNKI